MKVNAFSKASILIIALLLLCLNISVCFALYYQGDSITVTLSAKGTPECYLIGTFNSWVTNDPAYKMTLSNDVYTANGVTLTAGSELKLFYDNNWLHNASLTASNVNCTRASNSSNIVFNGGGVYNFSYNGSAITITATAYVYTATLPSWTSDANASLVVWAWGGSNTGAWYNATYVNNGTNVVATIQLPLEITGMIIVRFPSGTTASSPPNWDNKYNQTGDITVYRGAITSSYAFQ